MTRTRVRAIGAVVVVLASAVTGAGGLSARGFAAVDQPAGCPTSTSVQSPVPDAEPTPAAPLKIMALGDSITYGVGSRTSSSYRVDLRTRLQAVGMDVDFVGSQTSGAGGVDLENEGHRGWTIEQISEQIDEWQSTYTPDVVLLMIGTNDTARSVGLATAPNRLSALITRICTANPAAQVFVAKIVGMKNGAGQKNVNAFNAKIPAIVAAHGSRVHLVDQSTVDGLDLRDNLHPDDVGFAKMSYNWFRGLEKVYNTTGTRWLTGANPYEATKAYHCTLIRRVVNGLPESVTACRWWSLRSVTAIANGRPVSVKRWQTQRTTAQTYRVWVKGKYVTKTRRVLKWYFA
jgi:lysophospholipase L1-like esterase